MNSWSVWADRGVVHHVLRGCRQVAVVRASRSLAAEPREGPFDNPHKTCWAHVHSVVFQVAAGGAGSAGGADVGGSPDRQGTFAVVLARLPPRGNHTHGWRNSYSHAQMCDGRLRNVTMR